MDSTLKPYVLQAGEGLPDSGAEVKASARSTGGSLTLIESRTTGGAPLHVHTREDEYFYVVEGIISVRCGNEYYQAGARSFVFLPRDVPHEWDVVGDEATLLLMTIPAGLDTFLDEFHAASTPEEREKVAAKYGITFL